MGECYHQSMRIKHPIEVQRLGSHPFLVKLRTIGYWVPERVTFAHPGYPASTPTQRGGASHPAGPGKRIPHGKKSKYQTIYHPVEWVCINPMNGRCSNPFPTPNEERSPQRLSPRNIHTSIGELARNYVPPWISVFKTDHGLDGLEKKSTQIFRCSKTPSTSPQPSLPGYPPRRRPPGASWVPAAASASQSASTTRRWAPCGGSLPGTRSIAGETKKGMGQHL